MKIGYILPVTPVKFNGGLWTDIAGIRLRCLNLVKHLARKGVKGRIITKETLFGRDHNDIDLFSVYKPEMFSREIIQYVIQKNKPVNFDICDFPSINQIHLKTMRGLFNSRCIFSASSSTTAEIMQDIISVRANIIPDSVEGQKKSVKRIKSPASLLWFGRAKNRDPLLEVFNRIADLPNGLVHNLEVNSDYDFTEELKRAASASFGVSFSKWTPYSIQQSFERADLAILPTSLKNGFGLKSANRLEFSLWNGCPVACTPHPAFSGYTDYVHIAPDICFSVLSALSNRDFTSSITEEGQKVVGRSRCPAAISNLWKKHFITSL